MRPQQIPGEDRRPLLSRRDRCGDREVSEDLRVWPGSTEEVRQQGGQTKRRREDCRPPLPRRGRRGRPEVPEGSHATTDSIPSEYVVIGDLPADMTSQSFKSILDPYGTLKWFELFPPGTNGEANRHALVELGSIAEATWLVENVHGACMLGLESEVTVKYKPTAISNRVEGALEAAFAPAHPAARPEWMSIKKGREYCTLCKKCVDEWHLNTPAHQKNVAWWAREREKVGAAAASTHNSPPRVQLTPASLPSFQPPLWTSMDTQCSQCQWRFYWTPQHRNCPRCDFLTMIPALVPQSRS